MAKCVLYFLLTVFNLSLHCQTIKPEANSFDRHSVEKILGFEDEQGGPVPTGWSGGPAGTVVADKSVAHSGQRSVRLERSADSKGAFSTLTKALPMDFAGAKIELRGFLRLKDVAGYAGFWMREDGGAGTGAFISMQDQQLNGTKDWVEYSISLPMDAGATKLYFGALLSGTGTVWADDLVLLVDGKPIAQAPEAPKKPLTVLDHDREFDAGSRIAVSQLSRVQIENVERLGKVWGFLKYSHPQITAGDHQWDFELFRILPAILAARTRAEADASLAGWIDRVGTVPHCEHCVRLDEKDLDLRPDVSWIDDKRLLGRRLSGQLKTIYTNRVDGQQFFVSLIPGVLNPSFDHELSYADVRFPDAGFQLLALFRLWNILQYWSPNRVAADQNWDQVLAEFIPKVALAKDKNAFQLAMMALIAKENDTHANLWSALPLRPPTGECSLAIDVRFIGGEAVVDGLRSQGSAFELGDVVLGIDGVPLKKLTEQWTPFYAASNEASRLRAISGTLTRGSCGPTKLSIRRDGRVVALDAIRVRVAGDSNKMTHDLPGPTFRMLSKDVAYMKLSSIRTADVTHDIDIAKGTKGLVVDLRNYPSEFVVFALGSLLVKQHTPFVTFTHADLSNPGAFRFGAPLALDPGTTFYQGKVVLLVDEVTLSQAEYTTMALRSAPKATVVGSMTSGADGNVSTIPLPGGLGTLISGIGVFYPDRRPTQRVGIHIDVMATPSIAGIKAGRDEVLEMGIRQILGANTSSAEIERIARP